MNEFVTDDCTGTLNTINTNTLENVKALEKLAQLMKMTEGSTIDILHHIVLVQK